MVNSIEKQFCYGLVHCSIEIENSFLMREEAKYEVDLVMARGDD